MNEITMFSNDVRCINLGGRQWFAIVDLARKFKRDRAGLARLAQRFQVTMQKIKVGKTRVVFIKDTDVIRLLNGLRPTGEFAQNIKAFQDMIENKAIESVKTKEIQTYKKYPDPMPLPEKPIRSCLVQYVREVCYKLSKDYHEVWINLYTEFKYYYDVDLLRHKGYESPLDKCQALNKINELYSIARNMFDKEFNGITQPCLDSSVD